MRRRVGGHDPGRRPGVAGRDGGTNRARRTVVHGWDIAQATGQRFDCEAVTLGEVEATVQQVRGGNDGDIPGLFGSVVAVADDADALERVLSLTGRDPGWSPA